MTSLLRRYSLLFTAALLYGCANRVAPAGGPKDITPPVLVTAHPENGSANFNNNSIELTFNEYVQLKELNKQLIVSPPIEPAPKISLRKKSIVISLPPSLQPNTTYTLNFGNSIADLNEGNPLNGFRYVFATGSVIDSLTISGMVYDVIAGEAAKNALAIIYADTLADSLWLKIKPSYFARSDENGMFEIMNVSSGNYYALALADKNNNYIYDQPDEMTGFINGTVNAGDSASLRIGVSKQYPSRQTVKSTALIKPGKLVTVFARPARNLTWLFPYQEFEKVLVQQNEMADSVSLYTIPAATDTVTITWYENAQLIDTVRYQMRRGSADKALTELTSSVTSVYPSRGNALAGETNPVINWQSPLVMLDTTKISLLKDSVVINAAYRFTDSLQTRLEIIGAREAGNYQLLMLPGAVTDIYGLTNDTLKSSYTIAHDRERGSIAFSVQFSGTDPKLLQLVNDKNEIIRQRSALNSLTGIFNQVNPGTYRLRIITDTNNNGRWDAGDFRIRQQPEHVIYYTTPIVVRANWEVEVEWSQP